MKSGFAGCLAAWLILTPTGCSAPVPASDEVSLEDLAWLLGEWRSVTRGRVSYEHWTRDGPERLSGVGSRDDPGTGERRVFEHLAIIQRGNRLVYIADVAGNPAPVEFPLVAHNSDRFAFANPDHDFPKRIVYIRNPQGGLRIEVSGAPGQDFALAFERSDSP